MRGKALFGAAVAAGASYAGASALAVGPLLLLVWKGAGVGLLAAWALRAVPAEPGRLLALVLGLHAAGDVVLDGVGLAAGAVLFLAGHLVAIRLYLAHRRAGAPRVALIGAVPLALVAAALPGDPAAAPGIALYALGLGGMAIAATLSRFPLAALGAWLFVLSDLIIFAGLGPLARVPVAAMLVWPLYFAGQTLIAFAVGRGRPSGHAP